jgi:hypothetical protein
MVCIPCRYVLEGIDPSFLVPEEKILQLSDGPVEVGEEVESTTSATAPRWPDAFSSDSAHDALSEEREEELATSPSQKRGASFEKLTEAPY